MPDPTPLLKTCRGCGETKPVADFYRRSRSPDGLQRTCRSCTRHALDTADARQRAARIIPAAPAAEDDAFAALVGLLRERAALVAGVLLDVAAAGDPFPLARLADALAADLAPP